MNFKVGDIIQVIECDWSNSVLLIIDTTDKEYYHVAVLYNKFNGNIGASYKLTKRYTDKDYCRV